MSDSRSGFASLGLPEVLLTAIARQGFEQPSPIQAQAIPLLLDGHDLLGQAQTGTGKTAAFALPLLARLDPTLREPQMLILAPTRELAIQVATACEEFAKDIKGSAHLRRR
jgi:ATP-dependent RNA helicase DeaD